MSKAYDAIVVGARCAGSPTAMLLARKGYRVLTVDRATFPSDTTSTHLIHPPGVEALDRWGRSTVSLQRTVHRSTRTRPTSAPSRSRAGQAPRTRLGGRRSTSSSWMPPPKPESRSVIRSRSKARLRRGPSCRHSRPWKSGKTVIERANVIVGADGRYSLVADAVDVEEYDTKPKLLAGYYSYYSGLPMDGRFETWVRAHRGFAAWPTNDDLTLVIAGWPYREFEANRNDVERHFIETLELAPAFAERIRAAKREERFVGAAVPGYFRKPYGPGWALVGDAGYNKDFITAQGISDAFRDAELCGGALERAFSGTQPFDEAMQSTSRRGTPTSSRCTSSQRTSPRLSPRRPTSNNSWRRSHARRRRWTRSHASSPA